MVEIDSFGILSRFQVVYRGVLHLNVFCLKTIMFVMNYDEIHLVLLHLSSCSMLISMTFPPRVPLHLLGLISSP